MDGSSSESKECPSHYKKCVMCAINGNLTIFDIWGPVLSSKRKFILVPLPFISGDVSIIKNKSEEHS